MISLTQGAKPLVCSFGTEWLNHFQPPIGNGAGCPACEAESVRACAEFDLAVARGEYDAAGYTSKERKAAGRRVKALDPGA